VREPPAPVIAGVGQVANRDDDRILHPLDLIEQAVRAALDDAGIKRDAIDGVLTTPMSVWASRTTSELVAERLGVGPGLRGDASYSGAGPQRLLADACRAIAAGQAKVVVIAGGIADASVRRARVRGVEPPAGPTARWSQGSDGAHVESDPAADWPEDLRRVPEIAAGAGMPSAYFALVESALHAGTDPARHARRLGALLAPFTSVAASRPDLAWFPHERTPDEISTPSATNRMVAQPYTKLMCSFPTVDLAAALVVTVAGTTARPVVRPLAVTTASEPGPPSTRPSISRSRALERAVDEALSLAQLDAGAIDRFDLYSCFPAAVQLAARAFGLGDEDPRPKTVTGGLPYFGGPGASYTLHALACMTEALRADPGSLGSVVGVGGMVTDFSVGLFTTGDGPFRTLDIGEVERGPASRPEGRGPAVVDAMTVLHRRDTGPVAAPIIARFDDGARIGARAADPKLLEELAGTNLVGTEVRIDQREGRAFYTPVT
jgi:acetyl-CoA C-acetyltransferase